MWHTSRAKANGMLSHGLQAEFCVIQGKLANLALGAVLGLHTVLHMHVQVHGHTKQIEAGL